MVPTINRLPSNFFKRASCEGGGGSSGVKVRRPSLREKMYMSNYVISLRNLVGGKGVVFDIFKNRYDRRVGEVSLEDAVDVISNMLATAKLQNSNELFQTNLQLRLKEVISKVLLEKDYTPSDKAIKEYLEGGE
ncbi:MAG: hypothetical protein ACFFDK_19685 [Promethearchaeota archaeon]